MNPTTWTERKDSGWRWRDSEGNTFETDAAGTGMWMNGTRMEDESEFEMTGSTPDTDRMDEANATYGMN